MTPEERVIVCGCAGRVSQTVACLARGIKQDSVLSFEQAELLKLILAEARMLTELSRRAGRSNATK
jgi:hypothetical protein